MVRGGDIDSSVVTLTDVENAVVHAGFLEILLDGLAIPAPQSLCLGGQPDLLSAVFHDAVNTVQMAENVAHLVCFAVSFHLEQSVSGGANQHLTVLAFQQAGDIAGDGFFV